MSPAFPAWVRSHRVALRRTGLALLALYLLYLLAANVFLNTPLGAATINRKPERFSAQWTWAMSLYPGHIYARDVNLRGRVRTLEWQASGSSAHGRIHLLPLLHRQLRFGTIRGGEVAFDVKTGLPPMPASPAPVAPLAERVAREKAEGQPGSPPQPEQSPQAAEHASASSADAAGPANPGPASNAPPAQANARKAWELVFDGIRSRQVRRLSFGAWQVVGEGEARFAFYKQSRGGPLPIPASEFHMRNATLQRGDEIWARNANLDLDLAIARHVPSQVPGMRKLALTDAHLKLSGEAPALALREEKNGALDLRRMGNGGRLQADLAIDDGTLAVGGQLRASMPLTVEGARSASRVYPVELRLDVRQDGVAARMQVPRQGDSQNRIDADLLLPGRSIVQVQAGDLLKRAHGKVDLQWRFGSLAWLNPLISEGWLRLDGAADVQADLRIANGQLQDGSTASIPRATLQADVRENMFEGVAHASARVDGGRSYLDFAARQFAVAPQAKRRQAYVRGNDLRLEATSASSLGQFRKQLRSRIRFTNAQVPDLRAYNRYLPAGSIALLGGSGTLDGDMALDPKGMPERAKLRLKGRRAALQVGVSRISGNLDVDSTLHRTSGRDYAIDALRVGLDNVRLASAPDDGPWWARLEMDRGSFDWQVPFRLDGDPRLRMKDVSILMALFAERSAFPAWAGRLIDAGQVQATARIRVDGKSVVIDRLQASNERIELKARLRLADRQPTGDLYARWGILGLGVQLQGGKRDLHVVGAKRWYESRPALIR